MTNMNDEYKPTAYAQCDVCGKAVYFEDESLCHKVYDGTFCPKKNCYGNMIVHHIPNNDKPVYIVSKDKPLFLRTGKQVNSIFDIVECNVMVGRYDKEIEDETDRNL